MCSSSVERVNKAIRFHEFSSRFAQMLLQVCTVIEIFATCRAAGCSLAADSIDGFGECHLTVTGLREAVPSQQWRGIEWHRTLWVCLIQYKSQQSDSSKGSLRGAPWEPLLFTLPQPPATMQLKQRTGIWSQPERFALTPVLVCGQLVIRLWLIHSFGRIGNNYRACFAAVRVQKWFDNIWSPWRLERGFG